MRKKIRLATNLFSFIICCTFFNCSNDDPSTNTEIEDPKEEPSEKPEDKPGEGESEGGDSIMPEELLQKIEEIYGQASIEPQQVTKVSQLAILTSLCASMEVAGPISVTAARLNDEAITLVTLGGTEDKEGQATTMEENQLAAFGKPNDYLTAVSRLFTDHIIPQDKPVLVTGISLGGMIAQQLLGVEDVTRQYQICGVITFGSPITLPLNRHEVKVVRFADTHDKVPVLGETLLRTGMVTDGLSKSELKEKLNELDEKEKVARTSKYTGMIETHALSYIEDPCWNDVDFFGDKRRTNTLVLEETMKFYPAPKLPKE